MGVTINMQDLSLHTLMAVSDYASNLLKSANEKGNDIPVMRIKDIPKEG